MPHKMEREYEVVDGNLDLRRITSETLSPDSIELALNTKGVYTWSIKLYFDASSEDQISEVIGKLIGIDSELRKHFKSAEEA